MGNKFVTFLYGIGFFFAALVLINAGTQAFLNFDLVAWISFGMLWLERLILGVASIVGLILLFSLMMILFTKKTLR